MKYLLLILALSSCGNGEMATSRTPKKYKYHANYNHQGYTQKCLIETMQGCGLTLNCGYYGRFFLCLS